MIPAFPTYIFMNDSSLIMKIRDNVLRSEMEVGPQKTRPRQSNPMMEISFTATICEDKFADFQEWFADEISYGAKWFTMNDPFNGTKKRFRFLDTNFEWQKRGTIFQTGFQLEAYSGV